ncbi:MAG: hypothetical protein HRU03_03800 [Nanoarchaeales archaeon]|nr:hypothetical protein [Nanoarchaeales archaeon]
MKKKISIKKVLKNLVLGFIIVVLLLGIFLFFINGTFLEKRYLEPWNKDYYEQFEDVRIQVISHGLLAPNAHNKQSWKIELDENNLLKFDLYLDNTRLLPETDPNHRQTIMSHGTFLELVDISAKKLGYNVIFEIFPDGEFSENVNNTEINLKRVASVELLKYDNMNYTSTSYDSIFDRVTSRVPYLDKPLTQNQINEILNSNDFEGISIVIFQNSDELKYIKNLTLKGVDIESKEVGKLKETHDVLRYSEYEKNKHRDGLTFSSQGGSKFGQFIMESLSTTFPITLEKEGEYWYDAAKKRIPKTPAYIMILSEKNNRTTHLNIGRLYSRIQLIGTKLGLSMQPTMQITQEYAEMAQLYEQMNTKFAENGQKVQMLFRTGEAEKKVGHSPRRDVMELIVE